MLGTFSYPGRNRMCFKQSPPKSIHTEHAPAAYLCSTVGNQAPLGGNSSAKALQRNKERAEFPLARFQCCFPSCDQMLACREGTFWSRAAWEGQSLHCEQLSWL